VKWGHYFTKQILTGVINQSNNVINLLSKATEFEESINSIDLFRRSKGQKVKGQGHRVTERIYAKLLSTRRLYHLHIRG